MDVIMRIIEKAFAFPVGDCRSGIARAVGPGAQK
jgi:hypothetical protein